jgi:MFS family permease
MFSALSEPMFRGYVSGMLFSFMPMAMQQVAQGYLAYMITGSAAALGFVQLAWGIPQILLTLFAGVIADRYDRRKIMTITQGTAGALALFLAVLIASGLVQFWHLIVLGFLQGTIFVFNIPARQGLLPESVSRENLANGVALNNACTNMTRIVGPGIAGPLIAVPFFGVGGVYFLMAASYFIASFSVRSLPAPAPRQAHEQGSMLAEIGAAMNHIRSSPVLPTLILFAFVPIMLGMPYQALMPVFAVSVMDVGSTGLGMLLMLGGIGALAGSLLVAALAKYPRKSRIQLFAAVGFGLTLFLFAASQNFVAGLLLMPLIGGLQNMYMASNTTLLMMHTQREFFGPVWSIGMV